MEDIRISLNKELVKQGWLNGEKASRIGNPFQCVDEDQSPNLYVTTGINAIMQMSSMFWEQYKTPKELISNEYNTVLTEYNKIFTECVNDLVPFIDKYDIWDNNYIESMSLVRAQDFGFINKHADLNSKINHLDFGPGLGAHSIWSIKGFNSRYFGLDASPNSISVQRLFFRYLSNRYTEFAKNLDIIECENFGLDDDQIINEIKNSKYKIIHVPSWKSYLLEDISFDLVTATWMLNEINHAGICWLMSIASQRIKQNGYIYIRDSNKLKPGRHNINYDNLLEDAGFELVSKLKVINRVDYYGIPRLYKKINENKYSFDELTEKYIGQWSSVVLGGDYLQYDTR